MQIAHYHQPIQADPGLNTAAFAAFFKMRALIGLLISLHSHAV